MSQIFISYRRKSWAFTHRLRDQLTMHLDTNVFIDIDGIDDDDFEHSILAHLSKSDVFILIVTEFTFDPTRINDPKDWVRREIAFALSLDKPIVLVQVDNTPLPTEAQLPENIQRVVGKQAILFTPQFFEAAVESLATFITKIAPKIKRRRKDGPALTLIAASVAIVIVIGLLLGLGFFNIRRSFDDQNTRIAERDFSVIATLQDISQKTIAAIAAQTQTANPEFSTPPASSLAGTVGAAQTVIARATDVEATLSAFHAQQTSTANRATVMAATSDEVQTAEVRVTELNTPVRTPTTPSTPTPDLGLTETAEVIQQKTVIAASTLVAASSETVQPPLNDVNQQPLFPPPVDDYRITMEYGFSGHKGLDISLPVGTPITASGRGTVAFVLLCTKCLPDAPNFYSQGITASDLDSFRASINDPAWGYGFGNVVGIRYDYADLPTDMRTVMVQRGFTGGSVYVLYGMLSEVLVEAGDSVTNGTEIALSGNTGNSSGPHLHLELRLSADNVPNSLETLFGKLVENPRSMFEF